MSHHKNPLGRKVSLAALVITLALTGCQQSSSPQSSSTQTPEPVSGFIRIGEGENVIQGAAGQALQVTVHFGATSQSGSVTQMRESQVKDCASDMSNTAPWEPFAAQKIFNIPNLPAGITAFNVSVQYRDTQGELSPFYCENGAVEGVGTTTTPG